MNKISFSTHIWIELVTAIVVKSHGHGLFHDHAECPTMYIPELGSVAHDLVRFEGYIDKPIYLCASPLLN